MMRDYEANSKRMRGSIIIESNTMCELTTWLRRTLPLLLNANLNECWSHANVTAISHFYSDWPLERHNKLIGDANSSEVDTTYCHCYIVLLQFFCLFFSLAAVDSENRTDISKELYVIDSPSKAIITEMFVVPNISYRKPHISIIKSASMVAAMASLLNFKQHTPLINTWKTGRMATANTEAHTFYALRKNWKLEIGNRFPCTEHRNELFEYLQYSASFKRAKQMQRYIVWPTPSLACLFNFVYT